MTPVPTIATRRIGLLNDMSVLLGVHFSAGEIALGAERARRPQGRHVSRINYSDANKNSGITWNEQTFQTTHQGPAGSRQSVGVPQAVRSRRVTPNERSDRRALRPPPRDRRGRPECWRLDRIARHQRVPGGRRRSQPQATKPKLLARQRIELVGRLLGLGCKSSRRMPSSAGNPGRNGRPEQTMMEREYNNAVEARDN